MNGGILKHNRQSFAKEEAVYCLVSILILTIILNPEDKAFSLETNKKQVTD